MMWRWKMACSEETLFWMEILSSKGAGTSRWLELSKKISPRRIVSMLRSGPGRRELSRLTGRNIGPPDREALEKQRRFASRDGCGAISPGDPSYPGLLRQLERRPPLLFFMGDASVLSRTSVCVVGSRRPSRRGALSARTICEGIGGAGVMVTSGLARGIDTAAHRGAIDTPGGTCAVLGCGLDVPYPPENLGLAVDIAASGCLISEFPPGTPPLRHNFPRRNRILSGLSLAVVVVEAGLSSGAMTTARWAADQGRDVLAVPGPVDWKGSRGPHKLIRDGAGLVEGWRDVLDSISRLPGIAGCIPRYTSEVEGSGKPKAPADLDGDQRTVFEALEVEPKHVDELVHTCHISATAVLRALLALQMGNLAEDCGAGRYALSKDILSGPKRKRPLKAEDGFR